MAIAQDTIVTVGTGATAKSFGVSKTLDQYTLDDLKTVGDWAYSAYNDNIYNANIFREVWYNNVLINLTNTESAIMLSTMPDNKLYTEGFNLQSEGVFFRNVLVYNEYYDVVDWSHEYIGIGNPNLSRYRIVTDIELQDLKISIDDTDINKYNPTFTTCKLGVNDVMICPVQLIILEDSTVLFNMTLPFNGGRGTAGINYSWLTYKLWGYDDPVIKNYGMASSSEDMLLRNITGVNNPAYYLAPNGIDYELQDGVQNKTFTSADSLVSCDSYEWGGFRFFRYQLNQSNLDKPYIWHAYSGVKFELDGVTYKPIVQDGMITGYTDDMSEESEWDLWENIKDHVTPSVRPTPTPPTPPEGDDYDDMGIGTGGNVGGLTTYAIMTLSDLADIIGDFNANLETGQSVVNNFICCYKLGPLSSFVCTTGSHNIIMSAYSTTGNNFVSQRADYAVISSQKDKVTLGSITVPRMTNTFYDFSPYTTYELFIPCCGWIPLPDTVAGRTIDVYLLVDVASCSCKGIVRISGTTIAEVSGVIGSSVPFYVNDSGLARSAIVQGIAQTMSSLIVGGVAAGSGNAMGASMGITNALQSAQQVAIAGNTNYTAVRGTNGDMTAYANGEYCTIKIMHPEIDPVVNESIFGHTIGYLCNTVGELSNFHGFTICANPHVHISATSTEKEEIKRLLEEGVILP